MVERRRLTVTNRQMLMPMVDIHETLEGLVLTADLPGVSRDTLDVFVENNVLWIHGKAPTPPEGFRPVHEEYRTGDFLRSFILGEDLDT